MRGKIAAPGKRKRADYLLSFPSNLPLPVVEAKDNSQVVGVLPKAKTPANHMD